MASELKPRYVFWKNLGETPLEALTRFAKENDIPKEIPLTYAGRLDPGAEGFLVILAGEECKKKEEYLKSSKTYMAEILVGVETDSHDLLGIPKLNKNEGKNILKKTQEYLENHLGALIQKYPKYSSPSLAGSKLAEHEVVLHSYEDLTTEEIPYEEVLLRVGDLISKVTGDFRQAEIAESWAELGLPEKMQLISVTLNVGSGFYIRQLAQDLGEALGTGACLYSLIRTKVGDLTSP